jgi:quercetin dioxygenase-like cupin family protein
VIVPDRVRLPLQFDVAALAAEATAIPADDWVPHFNQSVYEGAWTGVALRSVGGVAQQLYPDPAARAPFADTDLLMRCPAYRLALGEFRCPIMAARLLALAPGALIKEHRDYQLGWDDGEIRVHVPILTAGGVTFDLDGRPVELGPGEAWYLDLNRPHRAANGSSLTRVHLVVDCVVDHWLTDLMARALLGGPKVRPTQEKRVTQR